MPVKEKCIRLRGYIEPVIRVLNRKTEQMDSKMNWLTADQIANTLIIQGIKTLLW